MLVKKKKKSCLGKVCHKLKNSSFEGFFFSGVCGRNQEKPVVWEEPREWWMGDAAQGEWVELRVRAWIQIGRATFKCKYPLLAVTWGGSGGHELGCHFTAKRF